MKDWRGEVSEVWPLHKYCDEEIEHLRAAARALCERLRKFDTDFEGAWKVSPWWADELAALERLIGEEK